MNCIAAGRKAPSLLTFSNASLFSFAMKNIIRIFIYIVVLFAVTNASAAQLDQVEQKILKQIESDQQAARALLKEVVQINSDSMNFEGVRVVGAKFEEAFAEIGVATNWHDGKAFGRAGHLEANAGKSGLKVLMIGHLDTVFPKDSPFQNYEVINNQYHKGPGITDMKGGDVIILYVIKALQTAGVLDNIQLKVIMTGDEEKSGYPLSLARKALIDGAKWADIAIGFEDGDSDPTTAVIARRGSIGWNLEVKGRPAHSSQIFREGYGDGAIFETARILNAFREELSSIPNLTFNPGIIVGGTEGEIKESANATAFGKRNVIAQTVKVQGDIRALTPEDVALTKKTMKRIVSQNLSETSATIEFEDGYPPFAPTEGNKKLLAMFNQVSLDLGYGEVVAVNPRNAGAADISFTAAHIEMGMDGLGLMGSGGHTIHEVADMKTFEQNMKRAAVLLYRLSQNPTFAD